MSVCAVDQISSVKAAMSKLNFKPRVSAQLIVNHLLASKLRLGDELADDN